MGPRGFGEAEQQENQRLEGRDGTARCDEGGRWGGDYGAFDKLEKVTELLS
jgi:hypothetical protein